MISHLSPLLPTAQAARKTTVEFVKPIQIADLARSELLKKSSPKSAQFLAYIEIEKALALIQFFSSLLIENQALAANPLFIDELLRQILHPLKKATELAQNNHELELIANDWKKQIQSMLLSSTTLRNRQLASSAKKLKMNFEKMSVRLVPIRQKKKYKKFDVDMHLQAAKAIAKSTRKLVDANSQHRLFTHDSDTGFLYHHSQPQLIALQALNKKTSTTEIMLYEIDQHLNQILEKNIHENIKKKTQQLIQKNKKQIKHLGKLRHSSSRKISSFQLQVVKEIELAIDQLTHSSPGDQK